MTTRQYKQLKELTEENLRNNITSIKIVLKMPAETSTTDISKVKKPSGLSENRQVAQYGGDVAGIARKKLAKNRQAGLGISQRQRFFAASYDHS